MGQLNTYYHLYSLNSVAHWYVEKAKTKIQGEWGKIHDVKGNAYIVPVITTDGADRVHVRFEIGGQKAWIAEWGRGTGAAEAGARNVQIVSAGTVAGPPGSGVGGSAVDMGSKNPYLKAYMESDQYNPIRRYFNKKSGTLMDVYRRPNDRPYKDLDGNVIAHGSVSPKVMEEGWKAPREPGKKGRSMSGKSFAKLPQGRFRYKAKYIVKNQLLVPLSAASSNTEETAAKCLYDYMASCAINRVCQAIEKAGGKRK